MLKNGIMSLIFKDIGIFKMDGVHIDESVKIWLAGFKNNYLQVFNYLEDTNKNVALGSSGIIEITFKNRPSTVIDKWWENLTKTQQLLIKENPLLISFCHEFWADEFKSIENFCDSINKKYEDVAIAFSNFNKEHQSKTKLKIINTSSGWMKWFCRKWFSNAYNDKDEYAIKKYVCMCGRPRKSRLEVINFLAKYNLLDKGHVSYGTGSSTYDGKVYKGPVDTNLMEKMMKDWNIKNNYLKNYMPLIVDNKLKQVDWSKYVDIELVIESFSENDLDWHQELIDTCVPFTEKTLRPMYNLQPFLVLCTNNSMEYEKKLGYYLFDDFHDNTPEGIVLALKDLITFNLDLKKYKQKEIKNNKELFTYHSSNDIDNVYGQIKEWIL